MKIILASASPRRKEILSNAGYNFNIIPSNYDENISNKKYSKELIENCAYQKALNVNNNKDLIVSADTVVVLDNKILGKPKDKLEAFNMLFALNNKTHFVATSVCLLNKDKHIVDTQITYVTFRNLKKEEIKNYIDTESPLDKAGSYGIQDRTFNFATNIKGDIDNVIGFPIRLFKKLLADFTI